MSQKILVIGSMNLDSTVQLERVPNKGETLLADSMGEFPGGKGANQALAAAKLGGEVYFAGRSGRDKAGDTLVQNLNNNRVNLDYLKVSENTPTGQAFIFVEADGDNRIIVLAGANSEVSPDDVDACFASGIEFGAILLQLEIPLETVAHAIKVGKEQNIPVIVDAGPAITKDLSLFKDVTLISPNQHEIEELTGLPANTPDEAIKAAGVLLKETNAEIVVLKMGKSGALVYTDKEHNFYSAFTVKTVDTTAAGDAFTAALTLGYVQGWSWEKTMQYANAAGALTVSKLGAYSALPSVDDVEAFIAEYTLD